MAENNQEIIAEYEALDQIVSSFASSIQDFTEIVSGEEEKINAAFTTLFDSWQSELATKFKEKMVKHISTIADARSRAENLKPILDDVANDLSAALNLLREGGEE